MSTACPLPDAHKIADLLGLLFDGLDVKPGGKFDQTPAGGSWYGIYVRDTGETAAMCGADTHLAASFGAALTGKGAEYARAMTASVQSCLLYTSRCV